MMCSRLVRTIRASATRSWSFMASRITAKASMPALPSGAPLYGLISGNFNGPPGVLVPGSGCRATARLCEIDRGLEKAFHLSKEARFRTDRGAQWGCAGQAFRAPPVRDPETRGDPAALRPA